MLIPIGNRVNISLYVASRYSTDVPIVTFLPSGETFEYNAGELPYQEHGKPESLLDVAMNFGFHIEHACGGNCACTTCHVIVQEGLSFLSEAEDDELDKLDTAPGLTLKSRLACQAVIAPEATKIVAEIPGWNRNYVSEGGGSMNLGPAIPPPKK